jgi:sugar phosphate isomerase/epimerase
MKLHRLTRRELLAGSAVAATLGRASGSLANAPARPLREPTIGIATFQFGTYSNARLAQELADEGIGTVQLFLSQTDSNYWRYNGRSDVSDLTADRCRRIAGTYRSAGIAIHSIGVYTNLIHPDASERKANLAYFEEMMKVGAHMDVRTFITEAGHYYNPAEPAPPVAHHFQEDVWKTMVETGRELARLAERHDATVLFEPYYQHFFASAKRTRIYLEEVDSPRLRALLDPANLLELNDLNEMFDQLGSWIECLHAKDRKLHVGQGVPAGQGDLDYREFVRLAAERTPHAPLVLEYVGPDTYRQALNHLRNVIAGT